MKSEKHIIKSYEELLELCRKNDGVIQVIMILGCGGVFLRKELTLLEDSKIKSKQKWQLYSYVDDRVWETVLNGNEIESEDEDLNGLGSYIKDGRLIWDKD